MTGAKSRESAKTCQANNRDCKAACLLATATLLHGCRLVDQRRTAPRSWFRSGWNRDGHLLMVDL
jgi:hypothetical protein